jgi:hypothetical protein
VLLLRPSTGFGDEALPDDVKTSGVLTLLSTSSLVAPDSSFKPSVASWVTAPGTGAGFESSEASFLCMDDVEKEGD